MSKVVLHCSRCKVRLIDTGNDRPLVDTSGWWECEEAPADSKNRLHTPN